MYGSPLTSVFLICSSPTTQHASITRSVCTVPTGSEAHLACAAQNRDRMGALLDSDQNRFETYFALLKSAQAEIELLPVTFPVTVTPKAHTSM